MSEETYQELEFIINHEEIVSAELTREEIIEIYQEIERLNNIIDKATLTDMVCELQEKYENLLTDYRISIEKRVKLEQKIDKIDKLINETIDEPLVEEDRFQYFYDKYWELKGDKEWKN